MAIKPVRLVQGDTIGIVTLGSPLDPTIINARIAYLRGMGFNVVLGDYVYESNGYLAGTDQQRASDLMKMFADPRVKMILPTRGGVGVSAIFPYLNRQVIQRNPKIVTGYSDVSTLLNMLYQFGGMITFQSLLLIDFKPETPTFNFNQFFAATSVVSPRRQIVNPPGIPQVSRIQGNVTGPIVGGNLTSIVSSLGTPFEVDTRGKIFVIEETHEPINSVYRLLNQLKQAGKLRDCIGIVMGECTGCEPAYGKTYEDLINEFVVPLGKPLMTNVTTAHGYYKASIPIGATANLNTFANTFTVVESTVS